MLRWMNIVMTLVFVLCVVVQLNDPDALLWILIYAYAVVVTGMAIANRYTIFSVIGCVAFLAGFAYLSPGFGAVDNPMDLMTDIRMDEKCVEVAREAGGLAITSAWLFVLSVVWFRRRNSETPEAPSEE